MASDSLHVSFDNGFGSISNTWNVDASAPGEVRLGGSSAMMEWATGRDAGHGYGTYTVEAKLEGNQPGAAIVLWPGNNQWPGQEIDMAEITPDGSGRIYGTMHWNENGHDAYDATIFDGVYSGSFHTYQMIWEPGRITYKVDGQQKGGFTDNVPTDFAHGGMNNTIGFLNNNPHTSITVREVSFDPLGGGGSAPEPRPAPEPQVDPISPQAEVVVAVRPQEPEAAAAVDSSDPYAPWTDASGHIDWNAVAAHVTANYEATGFWYI